MFRFAGKTEGGDDRRDPRSSIFMDRLEIGPPDYATKGSRGVVIFSANYEEFDIGQVRKFAAEDEQNRSESREWDRLHSDRLPRPSSFSDGAVLCGCKWS